MESRADGKRYLLGKLEGIEKAKGLVHRTTDREVVDGNLRVFFSVVLPKNLD